MDFSRRDLLRAGAAGLAGTTLLGTASAASGWEYSLASAAPVSGAADCELHDGWAFVANFDGITTYDLSNPQEPVLGDHQPGASPTHDNRDVKVGVPSDDDSDYDRIVGLADNGDPGGVTFYDASDPGNLEQLSFYDANGGVHNHFVDGDYAYLTQTESGDASFSDARMAVVDITDPTKPKPAAAWALHEMREDMAHSGSAPIHDIYVQDGFAYMAWWNAGVVVADVTDPTEPEAVAHFAADPDTATQEQPEDFLEDFRDYAGEPRNAHYVQPTPDREYTIVGGESFGEPTDTALSNEHAGFRLFYTPELTRDPKQLSSIEGKAGDFDDEGDGRAPHSAPARADPFYPEYVDWVQAPDPPEDPQDRVRSSHNADVTNTRAFTSWYQRGIRAFDFSNVREDEPDEGELVEIAQFDPPGGDAYWTAENLRIDAVADDDEHFYTVGSDIGKGLEVLELSHEGGDGIDVLEAAARLFRSASATRDP